MMTLSDYVIDFLVKKGIKDIFLVSGGGIMYLTDAVGRNKKIKYIANYHEQACATAAEAYARVTNHFGACLVTTGPGGTNAITGVAGAWVDSIPLFVISGQIKRELISNYKKLRQLGPQEINIVEMVKPITKYAKTVMDPEKIRYELERAYYHMLEGRPGPVWLDIPLDVQGSQININKLEGFKEPKKIYKKNIKFQVRKTIDLLRTSKRPVLIFGNGVRLSHAENLLPDLIKKIKAPVLSPINSLDLVEENNPYFMGKFGPFGQRRGNFTLQNSDLILSIGASLNASSIGYNIEGFAPNAFKIMVNIDKGELEKPTLKVNFKIESDAREFINEFLKQTKNHKFNYDPNWYKALKYWKNKYKNINKDYYTDKKNVNSYVFFDKLSDIIDKNDVITTGIGLDAVSMYQGLKVKKNQRAFVNKNFGQMGWGLPAAIGANIGNGRKRSICVTGDGSLMVNVHELEIISCYKLPIKIFVFNNDGYESIRYTQNNLFEGRIVGADKKTGVSNPNFKDLANAHRLPYEIISNNSEIDKKLKKVLKIKGPILCEIKINPKQRRMPRISSYRRPDGVLESKPLEDMWPFLPKKEVFENMNIFNKQNKI